MTNKLNSPDVPSRVRCNLATPADLRLYPTRLGTRICVFGTSGSGKTTLAKQLAQKLNLRHIELDAIHHLPGWQVREREDFRALVEEAIQGDRWIVDGNYSAVRDLTVAAADTLIWLDYPLHVPLWRVSKRSIIRGIKRQELWNGNRESLRNFFLSRESLFLWVLTTHRERIQRYTKIFERDEARRHIKVRIRRPADVTTFLRNLDTTPEP
jgi:adenylate kinase family enzyme